VTRSPRSWDEQRDALTHVGYEILMCSGSARSFVDPTHSGVVENALIESVLVHARQLIDFLIRELPQKPRLDEILRTDFASEWMPQPADAVGRLNGKEFRDLLNKHLAHLTWARVGPEPPEWYYGQIAEDINSVAEEWAKHLRQVDPELAQVIQLCVETARGGFLS